MRSLPLALSASLLLAACDDQEVTLDDTAGGDDTGASGYAVDVVADVGTGTVDLSTLSTVDFEGDPVVALLDVLAASGLTLAWEERTYDFFASDGYRPSDHGSCPPVAWERLAWGYIYPASGDVVWGEEANLASCYFVKGTVAVEVQDAAR